MSLQTDAVSSPFDWLDLTPTSFNWRRPPLRSFEPMDYGGKIALVLSPTLVWKVIFWSSADVEMNIIRISGWHQARRWDSDGNYSFGYYSVHFVLIFNLLMMHHDATKDDVHGDKAFTIFFLSGKYFFRYGTSLYTL